MSYSLFLVQGLIELESSLSQEVKNKVVGGGSCRELHCLNVSGLP